MAERREPVSRLTKRLTEEGLDGDYWANIFEEQLNVTTPVALRFLESKDYEKIKKQIRFSSEEEALKRIFKAYGDKDENCSEPDEHMHHRQKVVNVLVGELSSTNQSGQKTVKKLKHGKAQGLKDIQLDGKEYTKLAQGLKDIQLDGKEYTKLAHGLKDIQLDGKEYTKLAHGWKDIQLDGKEYTKLAQGLKDIQLDGKEYTKLAHGWKDIQLDGKEYTKLNVAERSNTNKQVDNRSSSPFEDTSMVQDEEQLDKVLGAPSDKVVKAVEDTGLEPRWSPVKETKQVGKHDQNFVKEKSNDVPQGVNDEGYMYADDQRSKKNLFGVANPNNKDYVQADGRKAERREPDSRLTKRLTEEGLDDDYWANIFEKQLNVTTPVALRFLESKDYEKIKDSIRFSSEEEALKRIFKAYGDKDETCSGPDENMHHRQKVVNVLVGELSSTNQSGEKTVKKLKHGKAQASQVLEHPLDNLDPNVRSSVRPLDPDNITTSEEVTEYMSLQDIPLYEEEYTKLNVAERSNTNKKVDNRSSSPFEDTSMVQDEEQLDKVLGAPSDKVVKAVEDTGLEPRWPPVKETKQVGKRDQNFAKEKSNDVPQGVNDEGYMYADDQRSKKNLLKVATNPNNKEHGQVDRRKVNVQNTISQPSENDYNEVLSKLGLNQYHPSRISLQQAIAIKTLPDNLEASDLPWKLIHMLTGLDQRARNQFLSEKKIQDTKDDLTLDYRDSDTESDDEESNLPLHPMDVLLATFTSCDWTLQQVLAQNLFLCKLAIPFLYLVSAPDKLVLSLWALRAIIVQCSDGSAGTVEAPVTDKQFSAIAFVRLGSPSLSKSKLLNDVLTDGAHQTFYSSECQRKTGMRRIANGLLECSWYLPAFKKEADLFPDVTLLLNLRGDAAIYQEQMRLVNEVSSLIVVMGNIENVDDPAYVDTFKNICRSGKQVVQVLTSELKRPNKTMVKTKLESLITNVGQDTLDGIKQVKTFEKSMNATDLKIKLQLVMSRLLVKSPKISIEEVAKFCKRKGIQVDENCPVLRAGKRLAETVFTQIKEKHIIECKRYFLPLQGTAWQEYSKLQKQLHRASTTVKFSEAKEGVRNDMQTHRGEQLKMCNNMIPFTRSFLSTMLEAKSDEVRLAFLQWIKLWLDDKSRATLPRMKRQYLKLWGNLQQARSIRKNPGRPGRKLVKKAEQDIADASFGLEHIFRELGQIYEASDGSSLITDKKIKSQVKQLPNITAKLLLAGIPLELLDGEASNVPITWVKAVLSELNRMIKDQKVLVLSVLGVQSSGKSTLLNTMFGLKFAASAGRCTQGAFMQVIKVDRPDLPIGYIAVIDTEGLRSTESAGLKYNHDNQLATFAIGLGDITLVNNKGENIEEIKDVLQIVVHAFLRMKIVNRNIKTNQACMFIHQNVPAINAEEKIMQACQKLQEQLDLVTQEAAQSMHILDINSFSQIIQFDISRNVRYFVDLWHGNPPMAPVNLGYSENANAIKHLLLDTIEEKAKSFLTVTNFSLRIEDVWKGILAEDFVFSFRNSLELKACMAVEEKYFGLLWEVQTRLTDWTLQAEIELKKCNDVTRLTTVHGSLLHQLKKFISTETHKIPELLSEFCEKSNLNDMMTQWKEKKLLFLPSDSEQRERECQAHLIPIKDARLVHLQAKENWHTHEAYLMKTAIELASQLKGYKASEIYLKQEFDQMWSKMTRDLTETTKQSGEEIVVVDSLQSSLETVFKEERKFILQELEQHSLYEPLHLHSLRNSIKEADIGEKHLNYNKNFTSWFSSKKSLVETARHKIILATNTTLAKIDEHLSNVSCKDTNFQTADAATVIKVLKDEIDKFNTELKKEHFSVKPAYYAKLAVQVGRYCVPVFTRMQKDYENTHGITAKLAAFREKAWGFFDHTVKQSTEELIVAEVFCITLKNIVESTITSAIPLKVVDEVTGDFGLAKHHLIEMMLTEFARSGDFQKYKLYTRDPKYAALEWIRHYTNEKMFSVPSGQLMSRYGELMKAHIGNIMKDIEVCIDFANKEMHSQTNFDVWISIFCEQVSSIPAKLDDFEDLNERQVGDFSHLKEILLKQLKEMQTTLIARYNKQTKDIWGIKWKGTSPYEQTLSKLWGCPAVCRFCKEPCSWSTVNHYPGQAHHCLQHRPAGVIGTVWKESDILVTDTCSFLIQSGACFSCRKHEKDHKECSSYDPENQKHPFREYRTFFPEWDIEPDPTNTSSKYWARFMAIHMQDLVDYYDCKKPPIPSDWKAITKEQAIDDLHLYRT